MCVFFAHSRLVHIARDSMWLHLYLQSVTLRFPSEVSWTSGIFMKTSYIRALPSIKCWVASNVGSDYKVLKVAHFTYSSGIGTMRTDSGNRFWIFLAKSLVQANDWKWPGKFVIPVLRYHLYMANVRLIRRCYRKDNGYKTMNSMTTAMSKQLTNSLSWTLLLFLCSLWSVTFRNTGSPHQIQDFTH